MNRLRRDRIRRRLVRETVQRFCEALDAEPWRRGISR